MNVLFCPVNCDQYPTKWNHWRIARPENNYKIVVCQFNNNSINEKGYDYRIEHKGYKWGLAKHFINNYLETFNELEDIEYVGILDDDIVMSYEDVNNLLAFAKTNKMDVFQAALTPNSNSHYSITRQDPSVSYTKTNFIEAMCPFFKYNDLLALRDFLNLYDVQHGWGLDFIFHSLLKKPLYIIHEYLMEHPFSSPSYNLNDGGAEFRTLITKVAPKYFKSIGEDWELPPTIIFEEKAKNINIWSFKDNIEIIY